MNTQNFPQFTTTDLNDYNYNNNINFKYNKESNFNFNENKNDIENGFDYKQVQNSN